MAQWDRNLPTVWLPQIPSCSSFMSDFDVSGCTQSRYGAENERLYNFLSSNNQNRGTFLRIFSASIFSSGNISLSRNSSIGSIQLSPKLIWWIWSNSFFVGVEMHKSSTIITQGKFCAEEVVRVAKESAWVFPLLGICDKSKDSNFVYIHLTWPKYSCILVSRASNSSYTWPTTSLESENISTALPPIFWTITIPISKASYFTLLFVTENPNLKDF